MSNNTMTLQYLTEQELKSVVQKWAKDTKGRGEAVRTEKGWLLFNSDEEFEMWRQNVMIKPDSGKSVVIKKQLVNNHYSKSKQSFAR